MKGAGFRAQSRLEGSRQDLGLSKPWRTAPRPMRISRRIVCDSSPAEALSLAWPGLDNIHAESQRTRYTVDFHKAPFTGLGLTFASHPETGEYTVDDILADSPASFSQIQIGDRLRMVSSACDESASAVQSKQAQKFRRRGKKRERVRFLFERPSAWELVRRVEPAAGPGVGFVSCSATSSSATEQHQQAVPGKPLQLTFRRSQSNELPAERRKMERPKSHREQATMLAALIEEATDLPPIPLTAAAQRRWALEFEGETLMTYRRGGEDRWTLSGGHAIGEVSSNIVPMPRFLYVDPSRLYPTAAITLPAQHVGPASQAYCVLPWLMMTSGQLETRDFETIASVCGLTRLLDLDLDSSCLHLEPSSASSAVSEAKALPPINHNEPLVLAKSAAALQRLVIRRGGIGRDQDLMEHCCILVHTAKACAATQLATVLAAWLHWYGRLDLQTAIQNAEMSLGISPDASAIAAASKLLLDAAIRRRQAVCLCWPYGGHSMEVAGDVLGGWHVRARLDQQSSSSGCSTKIEGLQPGSYRYKFIVDGMWVVDMALPAECDNEGNTNNVVHVPDYSPERLSPEQAASFIRVEAARMALAAKFGVGQSQRRSYQ